MHLDGRAAGDHQPDVWTIYTVWSHPCDDLSPTTLCGPGLYRMDLDVWHAGTACTRTGGCSSRAQAGYRSMACTTATSSRTAASHRPYCKLVCVGQEREGHYGNTTQGAGGRTFSGPGAGHARLCDGWDTRTPLTGGVTLVWDHYCRPDNQSIRRLFLADRAGWGVWSRSEEHTSELQSPDHLVCRLLLEKKKQLSAVDAFFHRLDLTRLCHPAAREYAPD